MKEELYQAATIPQRRAKHEASSLQPLNRNAKEWESSRRGSTMIRLRHNLCQGFPVSVSIGLCRAWLLPLSASNRACGFPAPGSRWMSRRSGLSNNRASVSRASVQQHYALPFEIGAVTFVRWFLKAALAASVQVLLQARQNGAVDVSEGCVGRMCRKTCAG